MGELLNHVRVHQAELGGTALYLRTGTSDLRVAASSLLHGEYLGINHPHPRVIVDAGANIGSSSIFFSSHFPEAKIFALEPDEENFRLLQKNTVKHRNIVPLKVALWSTSGERILMDRHTGPWGYTLAETEEAEPSGQAVKCITLKQLMQEQELNKIDILKIDIEGGEKALMEASGEWISQVDIISIELHDRIVAGCSRAFYLATKNFSRFEQKGEKVTAYRLPQFPNCAP